jgi:hypothetical protein
MSVTYWTITKATVDPTRSSHMGGEFKQSETQFEHSPLYYCNSNPLQAYMAS